MPSWNRIRPLVFPPTVLGGVCRRARPDMFCREAVEPVIAPAGLLMDYRIDRDKREVTADLAGLATSRSVFLAAKGCRVACGGVAPAPMGDDPPMPAKRAAMPLPVDPVNPALEAALDREFAEPESGPHRWTKAVVILHGGRIVAERYAPGYGSETPQRIRSTPSPSTTCCA
jgi:hypothetical protein